MIGFFDHQAIVYDQYRFPNTDIVFFNIPSISFPAKDFLTHLITSQLLGKEITQWYSADKRTRVNYSIDVFSNFYFFRKNFKIFRSFLTPDFLSFPVFRVHVPYKAVSFKICVLCLNGIWSYELMFKRLTKMKYSLHKSIDWTTCQLSCCLNHCKQWNCRYTYFHFCLRRKYTYFSFLYNISKWNIEWKGPC